MKRIRNKKGRFKKTHKIFRKLPKVMRNIVDLLSCSYLFPQPNRCFVVRQLNYLKDLYKVIIT